MSALRDEQTESFLGGDLREALAHQRVGHRVEEALATLSEIALCGDPSGVPWSFASQGSLAGSREPLGDESSRQLLELTARDDHRRARLEEPCSRFRLHAASRSTARVIPVP
jgi:hypothetical protein